MANGRQNIPDEQIIEEERTCKTWSILTEIAKTAKENKQEYEDVTIGYKALAKAIGIDTSGHYTYMEKLTPALGKIQDYCRDKKPPLTILVVRKNTTQNKKRTQELKLENFTLNVSKGGKPGEGFNAVNKDNPEELRKGFNAVYGHDWDKEQNPFGEISQPPIQQPPQNIDALPQIQRDETAIRQRNQKRLEQSKTQKRFSKQEYRDGQGDFRKLLLINYRGQCAFCGFAIEDALQACHIIPHSKAANPQQKIHPGNGILLCATHHRLYDANVMRFDENYQIRVNNIGDSDLNRLLITSLHGKNISLPNKEELRPNPEYIKRRNTRP